MALSANAQLPKKIKFDELVYSYDSSTVLIRKGSLSSVYDLKQNKYAFEPTKNCLINFPSSNVYAEINVKTSALSILSIGGWGFQSFGTTDSCFMYSSESNNSRKYEIIKCENGNYILNNYYDGEMVTYQTYVDERTGATVKDGLYHQSQLASGVYNVESKKWIIEPKYKRCYELNGYVFCLNEDLIKAGYDNGIYTNAYYNYTYDVFYLNQTFANIILGDYTIIDNDLLANILNCDTIQQCEDTNHYIVETNGNKGLVRFQLFDSKNSNQPDFIYSVVMQPTADFVMYSPYYHKVVAMYSDSLKPLVIYDYDLDSLETNKNKSALKWRASDDTEIGMSFYRYTSETTILTKNQQFKLEYDSLSRPFILASDRLKWSESEFGVELQKNGLMIVNNWCAPYNESYRDPLRSVIYPDEDSAIFDPDNGTWNVVYPPRNPGFLKSGIYDPGNETWIIEPKYHIMNPSDRYYFLQTGYNEFDRAIFNIVDSVGNLIAYSLEYNEILKNPSLLMYALPFTADSMFIASFGFDQHTKFESRDLPGYYVVSDESLGLYKPSYGLENEWPWGLYEFIHYNPELNFTYFLEGDSIYFKSPQLNVSVSKKSGKIIFVQPLFFEKPLPNFELYVIENSDTTFYGEKILIDGPVTNSSISMYGDLLIINDHTSSVDNSCIECYDDDRFFSSELYFESESSSAWRKTENGWRKISPDYATLVPIKNGRYIASSGHFYEQTDISGKWVETNIPGRYFLLDSNFKAISYLDYFDFPLIEDLGFGLKVCLDNGGCFFMTYNLVGVTDAEWDDFELFGKKLKAIKHEVPMLNEYGEQVLDESGYPIMKSESVTMFFVIP